MINHCLPYNNKLSGREKLREYVQGDSKNGIYRKEAWGFNKMEYMPGKVKADF